MEKHHQVGFFNKELVPFAIKNVEVDGEKYVEVDLFKCRDLAFSEETTIEGMKDILLDDNKIITLHIFKRTTMMDIPCVVELGIAKVEVSDFIIRHEETDTESSQFVISIRVKDYEFKKIKDLLKDMEGVTFESMSEISLSPEAVKVSYKKTTWFLNRQVLEK